MFGTQGCGELVAFLTECDLCWVVGDKVVFRQYLIHSVPPEGEWSFGAFDSVGKTEEVVEDSCDLVDTGCGDTCPQIGLGAERLVSMRRRQDVVTWDGYS